MRIIFHLFLLVGLPAATPASENLPPPPPIRETPDFEEVFALRPDLKGLILEALNAECLQDIETIFTFHTGWHDVVYLSLRVAWTSGEPGHWQGVCVVRKKATGTWVEGEVYSCIGAFEYAEMQNASDEDWERLLKEACRKLN